MENPMPDDILVKANRDLNEVASDIATLHARCVSLKKEIQDRDVVIANQYQEIARLHQVINEMGNR